MRYVSRCISLLGSIHFLVAVAAAVGTESARAADVPSSFTYQAKLLNAAGTAPLLDANLTVTFAIYNPAGDCLLYEETHSAVDSNATNGLISLQIGAGTPTGANPGLSMRTIFSNAGTEIRAAGAGCAAGYTPSGAHQRRLRVTVTPNAGTPMTLSPDKYFNAVPYSWASETLQGILPAGFIQVTGNTSQATIGTLTNENGGGTDDASTLHHHDSLYVKANSTSSQTFGSGGFSTSGPASVGSVSIGGQGTLGLGVFTTPQETTLTSGLNNTTDVGKTWYNSTTNQVMYWNGSTAQAVGSGASSQWTTGAGGIISYTGGNVGIGTSSPSDRLSVQTGAASGTLSVRTTDANGYADINFLDSGGTKRGSIYFANPGATNNANGMSIWSNDRIVFSANTYVDFSSPATFNRAVTQYGAEGYDQTDPLFRITNADSTDGHGQGLRIDAGNGTSDFPLLVRNRTGGSSFFAVRGDGNVGVGISAPTASLHLKAGTATAGTAPLKLTAGTNLTSAEAGAIEFDGTNLYFTNASNARKTVLADSVGVGAGGTGNTSFAYQTLTDGATVTWTVAGLVNNATVTLGGNRALAFSGLANGMTGTIIVKQDATGSRTLTLPAQCTNKVINGGAGAITLSTAANAIDILTFTYDGTNCYWTYGPNYN